MKLEEKLKSCELFVKQGKIEGSEHSYIEYKDVLRILSLLNGQENIPEN